MRVPTLIDSGQCSPNKCKAMNSNGNGNEDQIRQDEDAEVKKNVEPQSGFSDEEGDEQDDPEVIDDDTLEEQMEGSDADRDSGLTGEDNMQEEVEGSDADQDSGGAASVKPGQDL